MYNDHFGFSVAPFSISPDPKFLYMSDRHREALAHLVYGTGENGGFVLLTGQVGTGKTTLIRSLLDHQLEGFDIALCIHSGLSVQDFIASILDELGVRYPQNALTLKPLIDSLNKHLVNTHAQGRQTIIIIDEAQNLSRDVLEQVRLLTNLETHSQKLLRIVLVGQEELQHIINRDDLRQLSQRITTRYHLTALNPKEVEEYLQYRVKVAKGSPSIFPASVARQIYKLTKGVPRLINVLCDRALLAAYSDGTYSVSTKHIANAAKETLPKNITNVNNESPSRKGKKVVYTGAAIIGLSLLGFAGYFYYDEILPTKGSLIQPIVNKDINENLKPLKVDKNTTEVAKVNKPSVVDANVSRETLALKSTDSVDVSLSKNKISLEEIFLGDNNQDKGVSILLPRWGISSGVPVNKKVCDYVINSGLICSKLPGGFRLLKRINRPALLELKDKNNESNWVVITKIKGVNLTLQFKGRSIIIPLSDIAESWTGNFLTLLKKPNASIQVKPKDRGEQVKWLRQRIAIANGEDYKAINPSLIYDEKMVAKVKSFQQEYFLSADGIVGNTTLLYLFNIEVAADTPLLFESMGN